MLEEKFMILRVFSDQFYFPERKPKLKTILRE